MDDTADDAYINSIHPILGKLFFCPPGSVSLLLYIFFYNDSCIISMMAVQANYFKVFQEFPMFHEFHKLQEFKKLHK